MLIVCVAVALALASQLEQEDPEDAFGGGRPPEKTQPKSEPKPEPTPQTKGRERLDPDPKAREKDDDELSPDREPPPKFGAGQVPVAFAARPLIQPHRTYEIFVEMPLRNVDPRDPTLAITVGARHGFSENFELGVILFPVVFYKGIELSSPSLISTYRLVSGTFELGAFFSSTFPIIGGSSWVFEGAVPMLLHGGQRMRLDFGPHVYFSTDFTVPKRVFVPILLTIQITDQIRIAGSSEAELSLVHIGDRAYHVPVGAQAFYTITGVLGASIDLGATFTFPELYDSTASPRVSTDHWIVAAIARFYAKAELNPLDEGF